MKTLNIINRISVSLNSKYNSTYWVVKVKVF